MNSGILPIKRLLLSIALVALSPSLRAFEPPPGVVISHSPKSSGLYIGSPSICVLPDGSYLASHDRFGPKSSENVASTGRIYRSTDKGATWNFQTEIKGFFWQGLFVHQGAVYAMGTTAQHGSLVIRRSVDNGRTWTSPDTSSLGLIATGAWHTAPVPVIEHRGRLWRAVENAGNGDKWGDRYQACMASIPADADLLDAKNWTISNPLKRDPSWLNGRFLAWLEGNAVIDPEGDIVDMLRVDVPDLPEQAALVKISADGATSTFNPLTGFIDFPGGAKKFAVRMDPIDRSYWTLASVTPQVEAAKTREKPGGIRNTLALVRSRDLRNWEVRTILLRNPDIVRHGFQYVDWQFDGDDIIATCRTAWDDAEGGAHNSHDANFLTFHRWKNFRSLARKDDMPMPAETLLTHHTKDLDISGNGFEIAPLREGQPAFSNRQYVWNSVPNELKDASYTRLAGGNRANLEIKATAQVTLRLLCSSTVPLEKLGEWTPTRTVLSYTDKDRSKMLLFTRSIATGESLELPQLDWAGPMLVIDGGPSENPAR